MSVLPLNKKDIVKFRTSTTEYVEVGRVKELIIDLENNMHGKYRVNWKAIRLIDERFGVLFETQSPTKIGPTRSKDKPSQVKPSEKDDNTLRCFDECKKGSVGVSNPIYQFEDGSGKEWYDCNMCGYLYYDTARFCGGCGRRIQWNKEDKK